MATVASHGKLNEADDRTLPPFLRRVRIRGYKSIAFCDVRLQPLTILVGRNAAGKSNFLDALAFLRDTMTAGVGEAVKRRGSWSSVACRTSGTPEIEIEVEIAFTSGPPRQRIRDENGPSLTRRPEAGPLPGVTGVHFSATYRLAFVNARGPQSLPTISRESLDISDETSQRIGGFEVRDGIVQ